MPKLFEKGNPGRLKGAKNKKTLEWEEFGKKLIEGKNLERALQIMDESEPSDFMKYFNSLLEYFKPKLQRTEVSGINGEPLFKVYDGIDIDKV
jgi:hypothetical protein